jgi:hypothetical protein
MIGSSKIIVNIPFIQITFLKRLCIRIHLSRNTKKLKGIQITDTVLSHIFIYLFNDAVISSDYITSMTG